jgi:Hypervirulence associated proteins TUDOR domain
MAKFKVGTEVEWPWGKGHATAKVKQVFTESVTRTIKGSKITRHGTKETPAYLLEQESGNEVLKLETELHKVERKHGWV